ncbi:hypothetical protein [Actinomyces bowdenii]|uniref:Uncharacterized protein n=1 Tax=Actinomyces bowdenii TaxID=131109 RepID=A0A853EI02_9ACTO|nr:hypothetical protein [Actinomyces bowdenii]MBF0696611.1 hypothetical protein [Actinomyces bowdenii]NYS68784.1 hypothetical protein [Actinomyces bowdenii]
MSTDQTGVNDLTQDDAAEGSQGRAPRSSRRAIRQAERAAEREAILTGQQPLLTRREMRRLREEAKALKAAVEAGEITPEQARALQDPTAKQPEVPTSREARSRGAGQDSSQQPTTPSSVPAVGSAAQDSAAFDDTVQAPRVEEPGQPSGEQWGSASSASSASSPREGQSPAEAPQTAPSLGAPESHDSHGPAAYGVAAQTGVGAEPAPGAESGAEAGPGADAEAQASQSETGQAGPSWRSLTADEAVAISELPTGLMDAVDLPIISAEAERAAAEQVSTGGEPAPVPTRSSLRERLETGQVPSVAGLGAVDAAPADTAQGGIGSGAETAGEAVPIGWGVQAEEADGAPGTVPSAAPQEALGAQETPSWSVDQRADEAAVRAADAVPVQDAVGDQSQVVGAQGAVTGEGAQAPVAATPSSVRRPIVRIPAAAQGVRTVNVSTGELSAIQPVSPAEGASSGQSAESVDGLGEVTADAQETTVQEAIAVGEGVDGDGSAAPQWKSLRERMTSENSLVGGQQPVSPYSTTGMEQTTSVEYAPVSDTGFPEAGAAGQAGSAWDQQMPAAVPSAQQAQVSLSEEEPERSSGAGKVLLILLVVLVVALVALAIVWYLMSGGSSSAAAQAQGGAVQSVESWISQII